MFERHVKESPIVSMAGLNGGLASYIFLSSAESGGYEIARSLRFNSGDSGHLSRTPSSAGDRKTWSLSCWAKISGFDPSTTYSIYGAQADADYRDFIGFEDNQVRMQFRINGNFKIVETVAKLRDPSAWAHYVFVWDTTESTDSDRAKIYINGERQDVTTASFSYPALNDESTINNNQFQYVGANRITSSATNFFEGYLADVQFLDGIARSATDFGETDSNGVWQPKAYSGSYGSNGFHLKFADNSTNAALGTDSSGNSNTWTVNNLAAAKTAYTVANSITYYSGSSLSLSNPDRILDGNDNADATIANGSGWIEFNPPGGIPYSSSVEVMGSGSPNSPYNVRWQLNGGSLINSVNAQSYVTLATGSGTITKIRTQFDSGGANWRAIRVDGIILKVYGNTDIDSLVDTPEQRSSQTDSGAGGTIVSNYATLDPFLLPYATTSISNGNLDCNIKFTNGSNTPYVVGNFPVSSGKFYFEITVSNVGNDTAYIGLMKGDKRGGSWAFTDIIAYLSDARVARTSSPQSYGNSYTTNDVIGVAVDADNDIITFYKNGVSQGAATGPGVAEVSFDSYKAFISTNGSSTAFVGSANFGQRPFFNDSVPSGYKSFCTANLATPTIKDGSTSFDVALYSGNSSTKQISGLNFSPDLVWIKMRSNTSGHGLIDTVRGRSKLLDSRSTAADYTSDSDKELVSFNTDGFTMGPDQNIELNKNGDTFAAWAWNAGSSTVTNTDGSITSTLRANPSAGFSIVKYTGIQGSNQSYGHGLGATPDFIFSKKRSDTGPWVIFHKSLALNQAVFLNSSSAQSGDGTIWPSSPTSSVVNVGGSNYNNYNEDYIAYCFTTIDGYSAFGSYIGNGDNDGPNVFTNMRPAFILTKGIDDAEDWYIRDTARSPFNEVDKSLRPNDTGSEYSGRKIDILSNGFKIRDSDSQINESGKSYLYVAFAEHPFQNARAR